MNSSIGKVDATLWIDCAPDPIVTDMDIRIAAKAAPTRLEETLRPSEDE